MSDSRQEAVVFRVAFRLMAGMTLVLILAAVVSVYLGDSFLVITSFGFAALFGVLTAGNFLFWRRYSQSPRRPPADTG